MTTSALAGRAGEESPCAGDAAYGLSHQSGSLTRWRAAGSRTATDSEVLLGAGEDRPQSRLDVVELGLADDQRRRELDHRVAPVVGAAVDAGLEQRLGQVAAQKALGLRVVERLAGLLVLDELDPVEVTGSADVTD